MSGQKTPVVTDKTGLSGLYEFRLAFEGTLPDIPVPTDASGSLAAADPGEGPDLFTALEKQLGLRLLKRRNVASSVFVIDQVDKVPTEN
jgi:uncharacterized protein (TIGR03435 family)